MENETEILIDDRIEQAALSGDGFLVVKLETARREQQAQEFARDCKAAQKRLNEIKSEREHVLTERQAFTEQLALAGAELRTAQDAAHERNIEYNALQLKLTLLEDRLRILREDYNDTSEQLKRLLISRQEV